MVRLIWVLELLGKSTAVWLGIRQGATWPVLLAFFAPDFVVFYHLFAPTAQGFCRVYTRFETPEREVWLTIDDGPDAADTPQILDVLESHDARATFFVIGDRAARQPELLRDVIRRGHEIGHHTHRHPVGSFWCAGPGRIARELDDTLTVLEALGIRPRWFRAPVGIKNFFLASALAQRGLRCVAWTIRSGDCHGRDAETIAVGVMAKVCPGAILLLHEGPSVPPALRVRTIARVVELLSAQNYRCVIPRPEQLRS
jgi:peptidoglycan/xylan/chitin deacetylase (PgdA/CDA1 family)